MFDEATSGAGDFKTPAPSDLEGECRSTLVAVTAEGAALCYQTICAEGSALFGPRAHPEVTLHNSSLSEYMRCIEARDWEAFGSLLLDSAGKLRKAGADFLICPANTAHLAIDLIRGRSPRPWLHIAEEVAAVAVSRKLSRLLILGTGALMEGPVYPAQLSKRGIAYEFPRVEDRRRIDGIIYGELTVGRFEERSREYFKGLIHEFGERGCDGVVLGCTEIPLLISEGASPIAALDSTRLLARAALREAVG